tara:strand:- start:86 stop:598 length:513 start_codon:yes stop_codon:yes gene_type:complete
MSNIERQMDTYGRGRTGDTPIQLGGRAGEFGGRPGWMDFTPPQQDRLYTGRNPFTTPHQGFPDQGQYAGQQGYFGPGPHGDGRGLNTMPHEEQHYSPWSIGGPAGGPMPGIMGLPGGTAKDTYDALTGGMNTQPGYGNYDSAGLWQTWKRILERTGDEDLANQWLAAQQV